jgi:Putative Ig domain
MALFSFLGMCSDCCVRWARRVDCAAGIALIFPAIIAVGCGGGSGTGPANSVPQPNPLAITTTSLPSGHVGAAYSATLTASGGTAPYKWAITSGSLPAGLQLNGASGAISGTPTATANASALTFTATDSGSPAQSSSANLTLTIAASGITVSVTPKRAGVATGQALSVTATTNDSAGVSWTATRSGCSGSTCGSFTAAKSLSGVVVTYTASTTAGLYTITATSVSDTTMSASLTVAVTDLAGVSTYHNNLSRNGANTQEYALTPATVTTSTFGKLFSCTVDGAIYAQPLWVPNLTIAGVKRNVVFVATQHDSVYAFDADSSVTPCAALWHANLLDSAHGANTGETSVPSTGTVYLVGSGGGDIAPEVGITGTPVIDQTTNTLYVVSKSVIASGPTFYQRIHAIDLTTGNEKFSGPVTIAATYPGTGDGGSTTTFVAQEENQRPGLALVNGVVYVAWASHEDTTPFYGWVIGYNASNLSQASVFNVDPNAGQGGIWMSGGAPAADSAGNLYLITANGNFDATSSTAPNNDYGDSFLKLSSTLTVEQYFTPSDQATDNSNDQDFGAGGATVLVDLPANGTNPTHLVVGGGKDGALYVLNRDNMGGSGDSNAWQKLTLPGRIFATGAFWNSNLYIATVGSLLQAFSLSSSTAQMTLLPNASATTFGYPGATPSVTSMPDNSNGIVWALDSSQYCIPTSPGCGPAVLHAYSAGNLANELWNSTQGSGNAAGYAVKFTVPTVANGKVYIGTRGNNTGDVDSSTSVPGELDVYGLLPN